MIESITNPPNRHQNPAMFWPEVVVTGLMGARVGYGVGEPPGELELAFELGAPQDAQYR
jgi:hypothetical protein